jgi:Glycosyl hydrolases family 39
MYNPAMRLTGVLSTLLLSLQLSPAYSQTSLNSFSKTAIPNTYVGLNDAGRAWSRSWPTVDVSAIRLFDCIWANVEAQKGQWTFEHVDQDVEQAESHHQDLDLVLSGTPTWAASRPQEPGNGGRSEAADIKDWEEYVRTVAKRYKGRVHTYELWNEPNLKSSFSGDVPHLVELTQAAYRALKQVDPTITVISPSLAHLNDSMDFLRSFLTQGGAKTFDVLGFHFYDNLGSPIIHPENIVGLAASIRRELTGAGIPNMPVWNTESGYYIVSAPEAKFHYTRWPTGIHPIGQYEAVEAVGRGYIVGWACGLQRFYWYGWGEPAYALVDDGGQTEKKATQAYKQVRQWLVGSRYLDVSRSSTGLWLVRLEDSSHKVKLIAWTESGLQDYTVPAELHLTQSQDLLSQTHPLEAGKLAAGPIPQILF